MQFEPGAEQVQRKKGSEKKMSKIKDGAEQRLRGREVRTVMVRAIDRDNVRQESSRGLKCSFYTASHNV